ncbi:alpha-ketoglutarate-dependent sulfonate dioxygenase [Periconia macrospinosa]|uniref:Alpha-ketoglutarate-dependent sulfonate dioxygenase n=1 Tax=Periconia macrospinosa TaxID=97972 RepID=A0A2V1DEU5_9PLEO|nr:alpha-ketoglutarate-dependent sulfonate dioxygenase [Periconia macrospinosa]
MAAIRPAPIETLEAYKNISPDSGFPTFVHPLYNPKIKAHVTSDPPHKKFTPPKDRGYFADPEKKALFAVTKQVDLTESIGTELQGAQLSQFTNQQLDELAALVNERGVVFFRDQDLTTERQVEIFEHFGIIDKHPAQKDQKHFIVRGSNADWRTLNSYTPWQLSEWHSDTSFEINPPSYSLLRMEVSPEVGGDTAWISQYGTYDELSPAMQKLLEGLHCIHTSRLQYDTTIDYFNDEPNRPPLDSHHPAVRTHPVTGLKALNVNLCYCTGFAELKKAESDALLAFLKLHIHSADDHYVRWKWAVGSIALWDNRVTLHRIIPGNYPSGARRGIRTTVFGEKPFYDPTSEGRLQRAERIDKEKVAPTKEEPIKLGPHNFPSQASVCHRI